MKIAVIGAGKIGQTIGKKWAAAGHQVVFGLRAPDSPKYADLHRSGYILASIEAALEGTEVVLLALPWNAVAGFVYEYGEALVGKTFIDATNHFGGPVINNVDTIQRNVPSASVFRAFNSLGWEIFENPEFDGLEADHFYCGPDDGTRPQIETLIAAVGLRPIYVGGLDTVTIVDHLGLLWVTLAMQRGLGRQIAFKLLRSLPDRE